MVIPHFDLRFEYQFNCSHEHVFTRNSRSQQKRQFIQGNETLNDSVIGSNANVFVVGRKALESQADGH